jgi:hypothetical protein
MGLLRQSQERVDLRIGRVVLLSPGASGKAEHANSRASQPFNRARIVRHEARRAIHRLGATRREDIHAEDIRTAWSGGPQINGDRLLLFDMDA